MSETTYEWVPRSRDYEKEAQELVMRSAAVPIEQNPLRFTGPALPKAVASPQPRSIAPSSVVDPLRGSDPLRASNSIENPLAKAPSSPNMAAQIRQVDPYETNQDPENFFAPWSSRKAPILQKYTTTEQIIIPAFVEDVAPKVNMPVDKVKHRLEQLDQEDEETKMLKVTQADYVKGIDNFHKDLIETWETEKRVKSLKTAIKLSKMLGDTVEVPQFFPSKFVLITEILDTFGRLVFDRLRKRSTIYDGDTPIPLKENFRAEDVGDGAKELCKNWFYKIYSIRELVPRIYCEAALLSCYRFIENDVYQDTIKKLGRMVRGVADPLAATFAQAYVARKAQEVEPNFKVHLNTAFQDLMMYQSTFDTEKMQKEIARRGLTKLQYLDLFTPALDWLLHCLAFKASESLLKQILDKYKESKNGILLNAILAEFPPRYICANATNIIEFIKQADVETYPRHELYRTLGVNLTLGSPSEDVRLKILNEVWKDVTKMDDIIPYISVGEVFIEFPLKHLSPRETNILLGDIIKHVNVDRKFTEVQQQLQSIVQKILSYYMDFNKLFAMDNFIPLLDLFRGSTQIEVNKAILETFSKLKEPVSDSITINTMFGLAKGVHNSINALSFADDVRQISRLINAFISKVNFGRDVEKQLNFYSECRSSFVNLDVVKSYLAKCVCSLAVTTLKIVKGKHTKETSSFVRACIAYAYISIPSLDDAFERLYLYMLAGQAALVNQSLPQAESMFKAAITLIQEVPQFIESDNKKQKATESDLVNFVKYFISGLVAMPGHPEIGAFYLVNGLRKVLGEYQWDLTSSARAEINLAILSYLAAQAQRKLPYHYPKVEGNDELFGGTTDFKKEMQELTDSVIRETLEVLGKLKQVNDPAVRSKLARVTLDFINHAIALTNVTPKILGLVNNLLNFVDKSQFDQVWLNNTLRHVTRRKQESAEFTQLWQALSKTAKK
jgi:hypothetical protein